MINKEIYSLSEDQVLDLFEVKIDQGLLQSKVDERLLEYGKNELPSEEGTSLFQLILDQFKDKLVLILLGAAAVSFILAFFEEGDLSFLSFVEPLVILLILIANATIGVLQETNAEKAIEALLLYSPEEATVVRNSIEAKINATLLVPGDIVKISVGDKIPADCRVLKLESSLLKIEQSILTGESNSVNKYSGSIDVENAVTQDQKNMVFSGTSVVSGRAICIVVETGVNTALGNIHRSISENEKEKTPLEKKLDDFGDTLARFISIICILVWVINIRHFNEPIHHGWIRGAVYYFKIAVALAVAAIPEGLAVVITTCLALGTQKMAKKNAIVRTLPSVETLGNTSVICSDKTGTLTTNQMAVEYLLTLDSNEFLNEYSITGTTYEPEGEVISPNNQVVDFPAETNPLLQEISEVSTFCNMSSLSYDQELNSFKHIGEPTEASLKTMVEKLGSGSQSFNQKLSNMSKSERLSACGDWYYNLGERLNILEFSRDRKSMSVLVKDQVNTRLLVKGAPENILERCTHVRVFDEKNALSTIPISMQVRAKLLDKLYEYGVQKSLRMIALAVVDTPDVDFIDNISETKDFIKAEQDMVFLGIAALRDPPRPEVYDSIKECQTAGIRVMVITGDNPGTAESICRSIGIFEGNDDLKGLSFTGRQLESMSRTQQLEIIKTARLFSRTEPSHKELLVELLQEQGHIVAMTGDGVNDAPALKRSNIGISMGSGTDVAKMASDMILADDNFATITMAVSEGRAIYNNTKQFIRYLISSNIGEVVSIFLTVLLNLPEALIPVQLLWVNLVTDGLPATALGFNPPGHLIMSSPPRKASEPLVTRWLLIRYLIVGFYVGAATVFAYSWYFMYDPSGPMITFSELSNFHSCASRNNIDCSIFSNHHSILASTMSLSVLVIIEMFNAMNSLSENESLITLPLHSNMYLVGAIVLSVVLHCGILYIPSLQQVFAVAPLSWKQWEAVIWISAPVLYIDEILKFISRNYVEESLAETSQLAKEKKTQ
ncbi:Sarcoplasmic/endoplasmic reticulum calcium ATPase 3 [Smittium mucronatum]|uniref:Calcium-transporting ATPase n=1 Tax=Smittium mucronatum TaxID=133383 RepID=A0A1R0GZF1_9FUNG|nr:Sarcoplasmic/endoplasmic reticulum calcium ATPase 3 [Smittium mucronatum]